MTQKKGALGRGLNALIPEAGENIIKEDDMNNVKEIDINLIAANKEQPRKYFDEEKLEKLAESIKEHGIIQPVLVIKQGKFYKIIAGERRWRAARIAGLKKVPILEKDLDEKGIMEISLIENLQREDLNPIEEAIAYKKLIDDFNVTQEDISVRVGKSRSAVANTLRLLNLNEKVKEYIKDGTITEGHGKVIVSIQDEKIQYEIAKKVIDDGLNVRQTEKLVSKLIKNEVLIDNNEEQKKEKNIYLGEIADKIANILGTKVTINSGKQKGKIEIEYYSVEDLERIISIIK